MDDTLQSLQNLAEQTFDNNTQRQTAISTLKAESLGQYINPGERFSNGDFDIEIVSWGYIKSSVEVLARIWQNGKQLGFGPEGVIDIERFIFSNLPMLVEDPDGPITKSYVNRLGNTINRQYRFDPKTALANVLVDSALQGGKSDSSIIPGTIGSTTYTLYPPLNGSGYVYSYNATYSTARAGSSLALTTNPIYCGQDKSGGIYYVINALVAWDTSSVAGTISSAAISLYCNDASSITSTWTLNARAVDTSWSDIPTISTSDYLAGASLSNAAYPLLASSSVSGSTTEGAYLNLTSQSGFNTGTGINQSGYTGVRFSGSRTESGTTETTTNSIGFDSDTTDSVAGTGSDPKLVIVATAPTTNGNFFSFMR